METKKYFDCKKAIENGIAKGYKEYSLHTDFISETVKKFGIEAIALVLAYSVNFNDSRYHKEAKDWARRISSNHKNVFKNLDGTCRVRSHPALVDEVIAYFIRYDGRNFK